MKTIWMKIACTAVLLSIGIGCQRKPVPVRQFLRLAEETNRNCPQRLNETITLDSTRYDEVQNAVFYYYTASGILDDPHYMQQNQIPFKQALQEAVDNSVEMKDYREYGTTFHYVYFSTRTRQLLAEFSFTSSLR